MKKQAREIAMKAAIAGKNFDEITADLNGKGMGGILTEEQLEEILYKAAAKRGWNRWEPGPALTRVIGGFCVILGLAMALTSEDRPFRRNPIFGGIVLALLGSVLVIKPGLANRGPSGRTDKWDS